MQLSRITMNHLCSERRGGRRGERTGYQLDTGQRAESKMQIGDAPELVTAADMVDPAWTDVTTSLAPRLRAAISCGSVWSLSSPNPSCRGTRGELYRSVAMVSSSKDDAKPLYLACDR